MAQGSPIDAAHIEMNLRSLWIEVDGMPETAEDWLDYDIHSRLDFKAEWQNLLGGFRQLGRAEAAGVMTADQHRRYERLVRRYAEVLPIIRRLGLNAIPVPQVLSRTSP